MGKKDSIAIIAPKSKENVQGFSYHYTGFKDKLEAIKLIQNVASKPLNVYLEKIKREIKKEADRLTGEERMDYLRYELTLAMMNFSDEGENIEINNERVSDLIERETIMFNHRENVRIFFGNMLLIQTVIIFEEFLERMLETVFFQRPEILLTKSSNKNITYEELIKFEDRNELLYMISKKEAESILNMDINEIGKYVSEVFKIPLSKRKDWFNFKEIFYRRNIIVHNNGYPNSKYIEKTGSSVNFFEQLNADEDYIKNIQQLIEKYAKDIYEFINKKYS
jgi:hypothetical protein